MMRRAGGEGEWVPAAQRESPVRTDVATLARRRAKGPASTWAPRASTRPLELE